MKTATVNGETRYKPFQFRIVDFLGLAVIVAVLGAACKLPWPFRIIYLLVALYVVKYRILTLHIRLRLEVVLYVLAVASLVPYLYCCVTEKWIGLPLDWVGKPLVVFAAPTISFGYNVYVHKRLSLKSYSIRSLCEIAVLSPVGMIGLGWIDFNNAFTGLLGP